MTPIKELSTDFQAAMLAEMDKLPYTKHLDDGQYNDGQIIGFQKGAEWAFQQVMPQWISVEDALPGEADANPDYPRNSLPFQVIAPTGQNIAVFHYAYRGWLQKGTSIFIPNVTHWQPLPEPPQQ